MIGADLDTRVRLGDAESMPFEDDTFDLVFCSPPYESQRDYGIGFDLRGDDWVDWAVRCFTECLRVCRGLVAFVVEGSTRNFRYSATPFKLLVQLAEAGHAIRKPAVFHRHGIPGAGGPDWLRNDWEPIICATKDGKLPWSDNLAMGTVPKHKQAGRPVTNRKANGQRKRGNYRQVDRANPGNVIHGPVGGGRLGHDLAHENEAPFPEWLADFFIRSFCPPGGLVLDPFCGSGTTIAAAEAAGRCGYGIDIRQSQVKLARRRCC